MNTNFKTQNLSKEFFKECQQVKANQVIKNQMDRAALSVYLNVVEGNAKISIKERKKFFLTSYASFKETQALLDLLGQNSILEKFDILGAYLYRLSH